MTGSQVQRYLKVAELCDKILNLISEDTFDDVGGCDRVKGWLDAVYNAGKVDGRLTAYTDGRLFGGILPEQDGLIKDWQHIVDSAVTCDASVVAYTVGSLWLCLACGPHAPTAEPVARQHLLRGQTYLCDQCGQCIVDSV